MTAINYENQVVDIYLPNRLHYKKSHGAYMSFVPPYPQIISHLKGNKLLNRIYKQKRRLVVQVKYDERSDTNFGKTYFLPVHCSYCGTYKNYFTRYDVIPKSSEYRECSSRACKRYTSAVMSRSF